MTPCDLRKGGRVLFLSSDSHFQVALERRTADWRVAEVTKQGLQRSAARRAELAARQQAESTVALVSPKYFIILVCVKKRAVFSR